MVKAAIFSVVEPTPAHSTMAKSFRVVLGGKGSGLMTLQHLGFSFVLWKFKGSMKNNPTWTTRCFRELLFQVMIFMIFKFRILGPKWNPTGSVWDMHDIFGIVLFVHVINGIVLSKQPWFQHCFLLLLDFHHHRWSVKVKLPSNLGCWEGTFELYRPSVFQPTNCPTTVS